jgi:hypothetical protein
MLMFQNPVAMLKYREGMNSQSSNQEMLSPKPSASFRRTSMSLLRLENDLIEYHKKKAPTDYSHTDISELEENVALP